MSTGTSLLHASGLRIVRAGHVLLDGVDLQLQAGEVLGVVGPNGAGKSTLLSALAGMQPPTAGSVMLDGTELSAMPAVQRARALAWLEQRPHVHWPLSVTQVVALGRLPHGDVDSAQAQRVIAGALAACGCSAVQQRGFHTLSEGEKVRVHLARALAGTPRVLLADEPIAALDPWQQLHVLELLRAEAARGTGIALVLHDLQLAAQFCDRLLVLQHGRIAASGAARVVLTDAVLAQVWRLDASFDSATLRLDVRGRLA